MSNIGEQGRPDPTRERRVGYSDTHIVDSVYQSYTKGDVTGMLNIEDWSDMTEIGKLITGIKVKVRTHRRSNRNRDIEITKTIVADAFGYDNYNDLRMAYRETHGRWLPEEHRIGGRKTRKMRKKGKSRKSRKSRKTTKSKKR